MKRILLVVALMAGCASQQQMSAMDKRAKEANDKLLACVQGLSDDQDFLEPLAVLADRFYFPGDSRNEAKLTISDTANPKEKVALVSLRNVSHRCLRTNVVDMSRVHPLLVEIAAESGRKGDIWLTALLDDQITVGEYNRLSLNHQELVQRTTERATKQLTDNSGRFEQFWNESLIRADKALDSWIAQQQELRQRAEGYRTAVSVLGCDFVGNDLKCQQL